MSTETLYEMFFDVDDDDRESEENRDRYTRYHDAHLTVDNAYFALKDAIKFNAYDPEDEAILNGLRKRLFYFQRKTQEKLYELRDADPSYQENVRVIKDEIEKQKSEAS